MKSDIYASEFIITDIVPPYNMEPMMRLYTTLSFPELVDIYKDNTYYRLLAKGEKLLLVSVSNKGEVEVPCLQIRIFSTTPIDAEDKGYVIKKINWMFGLHEDPNPFYEYVQKDPVLKKLTSDFRGLRAPSFPSVYEGVIHAIIEQQISFVFAGKIIARLVETYGSKMEYDNQLFYAFPEPNQLINATISDLKSLHLSTRKAEYIIGISEKIINGSLDLEHYKSLSVEEVIEEMTKIRGIGRWTAEMAMIRSMRKRGALPTNDVALRRIVGRFYFNGEKVTDEEVRKVAENWGPFKAGNATFYLIYAGMYNKIQRRLK